MAFVPFNNFWKHIETTGGKKQTSGIKWVKILSMIDIHIEASSILFKLETLFSLKSLFLVLTPSWSRSKIS